MTKLTALLIDDEEKALEGLSLKIKKYFPHIEIQLCNNPQKGVRLINTTHFDLIFLDIEMPVLSGFDVLSKINNPTFEIIFVTAYSNYAIEAIQNCAIGYIVKPIDNDELKLAIDNALKNIEQKTAFEKNMQLLSNLGHSKSSISIPSQKGVHFIKIKNIVRFEGVDGYTKIHCINEKPLLSSYSIGKFTKMILSKNFFLCHKSHFINLNYVKSIINEGYIELIDNSTVLCARSKKNELLKRMAAL